MSAEFERRIGDDWVSVFDRPPMLGYAILLIDEGSALLDNIAVDPRAQQQGIGRALIDGVEAHLMQLGFRQYVSTPMS
jgi:ribosomal protein S18 acetylase RimI-like enzyme